MIDQSIWHKCRPIIPRRTIDGRLIQAYGQVWRRRKADGKWEYRQDPETPDEQEDRQW